MKSCHAIDLVGCCGLYCGLCNKFQSRAPSRCRGCRLGEQHSWCSIWNCCVKKHHFVTCSDCSDVFCCPIFLRRKVTEWIPAAFNLKLIAQDGLENFLQEQTERQALLESWLLDYNDGRSMSLYCKTCSRMPFRALMQVIPEAAKIINSEKINPTDTRSKAKILKAVISKLAPGVKSDAK